MVLEVPHRDHGVHPHTEPLTTQLGSCRGRTKRHSQAVKLQSRLVHRRLRRCKAHCTIGAGRREERGVDRRNGVSERVNVVVNSRRHTFSQVAFQPLLTPISGTVTNDETVEGGARNAHAARAIAGLTGDVSEPETQVVRRLVTGRDVRVGMKTVAQSNQTPALGVAGRTMSEEHVRVRCVAIQPHRAFPHDAHRIRQSVGNLPRNNRNAAANQISLHRRRQKPRAVNTVRPRRVAGQTGAVAEAGSG